MAISKEERLGIEFGDVVLEYLKKTFRDINTMEESLTKQMVKDLVLLASENRDILSLDIIDDYVHWHFSFYVKISNTESDPIIADYNEFIDKKENDLSLRKQDIQNKKSEIMKKYDEETYNLYLKYEPDYGTSELKKIFKGCVEVLKTIESEDEDVSDSDDENIDDNPFYIYLSNYMSKEKFNDLFKYIEELEEDEIKYYKKYIKKYNIGTNPHKEIFPESYEINDLNARPYSEIKITSLTKEQVINYEHVNLEINCDIPEDFVINIKDGNLTINGNLKKNVQINVDRIPQINFRCGFAKMIFDSIERTKTGYNHQGSKLIKKGRGKFEIKDGVIYCGTREYPIPEGPMPELKGFVRINGDIDDTVTYDLSEGYIIHNGKNMEVLPRGEELDKEHFSMFFKERKGWKPNLSVFNKLIKMYDINKLSTRISNDFSAYYLLNKTSQISTSMKNGLPIIFSLIKANNRELIGIALSQISNINYKDKKKGTLLYQAISLKLYEAAEELIARGAFVDYCEPEKKFDVSKTLLYTLSLEGDHKGLEIIARYSRIITYIHYSNPTPLQAALMNGHINCARVLVNHGALQVFKGDTNSEYMKRLDIYAEHGKCKTEFLSIKQNYLCPIKTKAAAKLKLI